MNQEEIINIVRTTLTEKDFVEILQKQNERLEQDNKMLKKRLSEAHKVLEEIGNASAQYAAYYE